MSKLYHYIQEKGKDSWEDCISVFIPAGAIKKPLINKDKFDWCVKTSFERKQPYMGALSYTPRQYGFILPRCNREYDRYFSEKMKLMYRLSDRVKLRFEPEKSGKATSGKEFSSGKFYSVASSSRFAVASFTKKKNEKLDYIESIIINGIEEKISMPEFEHDTPITGIEEGKHCPQMDFFFKTQNGTFFIEAKNHEILDNHKSIELSSSYLKTEAFEKLGLEGETCEREYTDSEGKVHRYISLKKYDADKKHLLLASDFKCELKTSHFDFKQFLCHLMGIWSYAQKNSGETIYFYYLIYKNKLYEEMFDEKLYDRLESEVKTVFDVFRKRFPNIHFGLCYNDQYDTMKEIFPLHGV